MHVPAPATGRLGQSLMPPSLWGLGFGPSHLGGRMILLSLHMKMQISPRNTPTDMPRQDA